MEVDEYRKPGVVIRKDIGAYPAVDDVTATSRDYPIVATVTTENVVAAEPTYQVVAFQACDDVVTWGAAQVVGAGRAADGHREATAR
ncbi:MAG: hypothetical protein A2Z12_02925 [Actinobacteria bacterium RBG_16_68_21]|nr:MAG: hypothetical protein A2Z12_02925 [Actinobacteria bacterium RBG_16_68_21]